MSKYTYNKNYKIALKAEKSLFPQGQSQNQGLVIPEGRTERHPQPKNDVHIIHFPESQHHEASKKHKYLLSEPKRNKFDHYAIIKVFLNTVSAMNKTENNNILVFANVEINKHQNKYCEENLRH